MSVLCCGEADESNGADHAQWCQNFDFDAHIAAAERRGWARAIEALRDVKRYDRWLREHFEGGGMLPFRLTPLMLRAAADYLTGRAAALTEGGSDGS